MKALFILIVPLFLAASPGEPPYYAVLRPQVTQLDSIDDPGAWRDLANTCDRILVQVKDDWLPYFYRSYAYVYLGYMTEDERDKDRLLDEALKSFNEALALAPEESEVILLEALICYGRMEINPMARAPKYLSIASKALEKAKGLNPENPRIYYLEAKTTLNKPAFMGGGMEAALPAFETAMSYYAAFEKPYDLYPHWGFRDASRLYQECREKAMQNN
jgi:tetratricopeptide (TPR) repeat protein